MQKPLRIHGVLTLLFVLALMNSHLVRSAVEQSCVPNTSPLLMRKDPEQTIPEPLVSTLNSDYMTQLNNTCLIILGDSTSSETVADLAFLFEAFHHPGENMTDFYNDWMYQSSHVSSKKTHKENHASSFLAHHINYNRHWWVKSLVQDTIVYYRFASHQSVHKNNVGLVALSDENVRSHLLKDTNSACGSRKRKLWLNTGYHDIFAYTRNKTTLSEGKKQFPEIFDWLSTNIAQNNKTSPDGKRKKCCLFLSRQPPPYPYPKSFKNMYGFKKPDDHIELNSYFKNLTNSKSDEWTYVNYQEALGCEKGETWGMHGHIGNICWNWTRDYQKPYMSVLQTILALSYHSTYLSGDN